MLENQNIAFILSYSGDPVQLVFASTAFFNPRMGFIETSAALSHDKCQWTQAVLFFLSDR